MSDKATSAMVDAELAALPGEDEAETIDLFADPVTERAVAKYQPVARGPGRPANSRNKRNERTLAWLRARYPDPRERLLAVLREDPRDLAILWGCTPFEAQQEQRLCAGVVLPYIAQKQPLSVNLETRTAVHLHVDLGGISVGGDGAINVTPRVLDIEEIQELSPKEDPDV